MLTKRVCSGSSSPSALWELLENPRDLCREIPADRFDVEGYYHQDAAHHGTTNVRRAYLLDEDVRAFDASFFNISRKEADSMDPQQRMLMELVYEALESGGHTVEGLRGSNTAVYVGVMGNDYEGILMRDINSLPTYFATGTSRAILSNRVSYFFDWHGPSMTIDTACSSSLVAIHQSVQALRTGESRVAVACGTTVILGPEAFVAENKLNMLSPTGRSRMWDADAEGYARGEGVAAIVLKRLSDALADGDHIECLIRETGVNQDGRSTGLTVPSSEAQTALIRQTYAKAGLDLTNPRDRPQFFEAHGTGTKAGDPREAEAIQSCFGGTSDADDGSENTLYVGSVKTVIGHTEGAAGLAGLLKGSLAIQHGVIPPNMLFNHLNPAIEPFYHGLRVPTSPIPWPALAEGSPRRVSVNSFGFGGANAHAILESYDPEEASTQPTLITDAGPFTPYTFSSATELSLESLLQSYSSHLKTQRDMNPCDLAWTLQSCRTAHPIKVAISARSIDGLLSKIDGLLETASRQPGTNMGVRTIPVTPRILGVFTGQGAQWATMGRELIRSSTFVRERIQHLETSLATLPPSDRPSWHLQDELLADAETSRISEAELSQPLCTAIQVVLVDLLRAAGITFQAVVGHSSGEIAAAYAADFISAHDAVRIAYYRGLHARLAGDLHGQKGAMLAVGTSREDAQELVELPAFRGRISVAAHNSSASITLSGNVDAVIHAKKVFDEEKKFARMLKVDTAYHSHHMVPCGEPYVQSIRRCGIRVNQERSTSCTWYSSVFPGEAMESIEALKDVYWRDNMVNPVLFADAVEKAAIDKLNLALEVGPHPALKGPATQNIADVTSPLPYCGVLSRGVDDVEAFSDALGFVWAHLGPKSVNMQAYENLMSGGSAPRKFVVGLPSYQWNHGTIHWNESRKSKRIRSRADTFHELLGVSSPNSTGRDRRWMNSLKASEIPWLEGHKLQGQMVFPAAGYVAMALEAAKKLAGERPAKLLELKDLIIGKAIAFEDDNNFAVETLVTLTSITTNNSENKNEQTADFACYSCANNGPVDMDLVASGKVRIVYGAPSPTTLSSVPLETTTNMNSIAADAFYDFALNLGYQYTGPFRGMTSLNRSLDQASALVHTYKYSDDEAMLIVHPTMLDIAFQALLLAWAHPEDESVWALHVPTSIGCIRVNPELCASLPTTGTQLPISTVLHREQSHSICGSVDIFSEDGQYTLIQAEDLAMKPFSPATVEDDRRLFTSLKWDYEMPNAISVMGDERPSVQETELASLCERLSYYYLQKWKSQLGDEEWENGEWHHQRLRDYMNHTLSIIDSGKHPWIRKEWSGDRLDEIEAAIGRHSGSIDIRLIKVIGENIPSIVRGQTSIMEHVFVDNLMNDMYMHGLGLSKFSSYLAAMVRQLAHRYPNASIFEIGAGTGGTTKEVLQALGDTFSSYTFTDISEGFFENAEKMFKVHSRKMEFKVFDVESTPASQGFPTHSYDIVIAAMVLHATTSLQKTLEHARQLLKPGGHLIFFEITQAEPLRLVNLVAGFSGWWAAQDGRQNGPIVSPKGWHDVLRKAGFSGVDSITPPVDGLTWPYSIIASQAVNTRVDFLRRPLSPSPLALHINQLYILGTGSLETLVIAEGVRDILCRFCDNIEILDGLPTEADTLAPMNTLVNLVDLDDPVFKDMTEAKIAGLKRVCEVTKNMIWVTRGAHADDPYQMASVGFGRALRHEIPYLSLSYLDLGDTHHDCSKFIAEALIRQCTLEEWESQGNVEQGLLWSQEPERLLKDSQLMIPRWVAHHDQNDRINSLRRDINKTLSPSDSMITIAPTGSGSLTLQEDAFNFKSEEDSIRVKQSVLMALNVTTDTFLFLSVGLKETTGQVVLALSSTISSRTTPSAAIPMEFDPSSGLLAAIAGELLARSLLSAVAPKSNLLVHEPGNDQVFARALKRRAMAKGVHLSFSSAVSGEQNPGWIKFTPWTPRHVVRRRLPAQLTHYLDLATEEESRSVSLSIVEALPRTCRRIEPADLFRHQTHTPLSGDESDLRLLLEDAISNAKAHLVEDRPSFVITLDHVGDASVSRLPTTIVDWTSSNKVNLQVKTLDARHMFSKNKTYLLVGLTGQIGQSVSGWMARNGAGCICLTSRRPNVDARWLESLAAIGATVKVFAMDVTDRQVVEQVVGEIRATCPPIAGLANAAMVLQDVLFSDMSLDQMQKVLRPKIDGTNHLADIFRDVKLDFFVMFSSASSVLGNAGQSNYAAACAYMQTVAHQRRKRGLAASTFDIGRVVGIGYVERAEAIVKEQLIKYGYMPISETDFHQVFAETIRAGYPELGAFPVLTTGISAASGADKVPWFDDPRLSHCIVNAAEVHAQQDDKSAGLPAMEQLANATTLDEALEILKASLAAKLRMVLQITDHDLDQYVPVIDHGIDSLVAVEVRSWFVKELKVDMPVLKILGGGSIADLSEQALKQLPEKALSSIGKDAISARPSEKQDPQVMPQHTGSVSESSTTSVATPPGISSFDHRTGEDESTERSSTPSSSTGIEGYADPKERTLTTSSTDRRSFLKSALVSFAQSRFWFLRLLLQDQTTFNITLYYKVTGNLRVGDLERAVRAVGSRHEALRTCFVADAKEGDIAYQKVTESSILRLEQKGIQREEDVLVEYANLQRHEFDVENGEMMRLVLLTSRPSTHYLLVNYHHMLMDGVGLQIFLADLEKAYRGHSLSPSLSSQPIDFSEKQHEDFESGKMDNSLKFWRDIFSDEPPVLPLLPIARTQSRMPLDKFNLNQVLRRLEPSVAARVKQVSRAQRSTPFHFYLAAFKALLFRLTKTNDLTIGIADANRPNDEAMTTVGLFLNLLTLRFRHHPGQSFAHAITEARNVTYAALSHSDLPFDVLLKELNVPRSSHHSPFFQAFFDYRQGAQEKHTFDNCLLEMQEAHPGRTAYDITLDVTDSAAGTLVAFRTQTSLYDQAATELLCDMYIGLIDVLSKATSVSWSDVELFGADQITHAVAVGRGPDLQSDWPATLPHRIDQIGEANKDKVAIMDGTGSPVTYADMAQRIQAVSEALMDVEIETGSKVLVLQDATSDWICSMLAIMRVGATYVPLDRRNPLPRLASIAQDCQPSVVLVDATTRNDAAQLDVPAARVIDITGVGSRPTRPIPNSAQAESVAAILYTSGSTGKPKGIMVKHSGLRNEIEGYTKSWGLGAERVLQQSSFTFNHSSDQIYTGLVNGGTVYIVPWDKRGDPLEITNIVRENKITYTKATPSEYSLWLQYGMESLSQALDWQFAFGGGETLSHTVIRQFRAMDLPRLRFFNSYGPTEISISSHKMEIPYRDEYAEGRIPCGHSLPNYATYILDEQLKPVPAGIPGEVVIGGAGVSLGYLNNEQLTIDAFVPDPYATPDYVANGWTRMYRTSDIGHLTPDGALVFHSRIAGDTQVKIRGLRIELSDIEGNILSAAGGILSEAVVTLREGDPEILVAHVVFAPQHDFIDRETFLQHLLEHLPIPQYMIPVMAVPLDRLPLSNHSKTDRRAIKDMPLPDRAMAPGAENREDHRLTETSKQLRRVWEDVLGNGKLRFNITPETSFFAVGGNSLLVVRLQSRIRDVFHVVVRLVDLLGANTLGDMVRRIEESGNIGVIDWDAETTLPDLDIPALLNVKSQAVRTEPKTVLLTGATGYMAKYLLPQLVASPTVDRIHCIAVRNKGSESSPRQLATTSTKISTYTGDLSLPRFGLPEPTFAALCGEVDVILHMGASRAFWDNYHVLRASNVGATKELVRLAAARRVPIHYISSAGVLPYQDDGGDDAPARTASSAAGNMPPTDGSNGYVASRWASERILERAAQDLGIPAVIHRFVPAGQPSQFEAIKPALDEFIRFIDISGLIPDLSGWDGCVDIMLAEQAAKDLCDALVDQKTDESAGTRFVHHECHISIEVADMKTYIQSQRGQARLEGMAGIKWVGRIKALGFGYLFASQDISVQDQDSVGSSSKVRLQSRR